MTNPSFTLAELATLPVLGSMATSRAVLAKAYERTNHMPAKPWKFAADDDMRECLDRAAAGTTGIDLQTIRGWRVRTSREPTLTNELTKQLDIG